MNLTPTLLPSLVSERLQITNLLTPTAITNVSEGEDAIAGLTQTPKSLPPKYFYDQYGSELFEQICDLPEYYLTRTETAILKQVAPTIVQLTGPCELVELGSGSATKTRLLLDAYQAAQLPLDYHPIDVSGTMLTASSQQLLQDYPQLTIKGLVGTYEAALEQLPTTTLATRMICFIGSTLGNLQPLECEQFIARISTALQAGEFFLLGIDLQKPKALLEAAYNDAQGVTAAFNLNMLRHLNWRFGGNFELDHFAHIALYNQTAHQIELYLKSLKAQTVSLAALNLTVNFAQGERLRTEISRKFSLQSTSPAAVGPESIDPESVDPESIVTLLANHQLPIVSTFTDDQNWFGLLLCQKT